MAPTAPRLRILSVGGNAVSAFMSWRLSATNACDVTLVWKSGFENVSQYGLSFKSSSFGNERFKPRQVVRTPEEAAKSSRSSFDYVLLCVKALPDVYDIASIIEPVVAPQHTCILINTTHSLGVESYLEQRFPTNVVLSLVAGAELSQLGPSEFEHKGSTEIWVGPANKNPSIPSSIQADMAEALAMTLSSGQVDCKVSPNIRQQQYERMIGPIAFHPASVLFETPNHAELLEKTGARSMIMGVIEELMHLAKTQGCSFNEDFREQLMESMIQPTPAPSTMYQDFTARRPLEIETFLGAPIRLAQDAGVAVPRIETLYALLHNANTLNQNRPPPTAAVSPGPSQTQRVGPGPMQRGPMNGPMNGHLNGPMNGHMNGPVPGPPGRPGMRPGSRAPSMTGAPAPMRRGPSMNGFGPQMRMNGNGPRGPPQPATRRQSLEGEDLEEFSHLMLYDNLPEGAMPEGALPDGAMAPGGNMGMRERELALRQRELALREQEFNMRRRMPPPPASRAGGYDDDDEDGEDYFDPMAAGHNVPMIDPDNFDMMSVTSRRTRKAPSANQLRNNPEMGGAASRGGRGMFGRPKMQNRTSARLMADVPGLHENLMGNALLGYSSDRYGGVDRHNLGNESRTNSLTAERLNELQRGGPPGAGPYPGPMPGQMNRRTSNSPGNPLGPPRGHPGQQRPYPPNGPNGYPPHMPPNGRPSPPGTMGSPMPRPPTQQGQAPQHVEQQVGVSHLYPPKSGPQERSLTGSASASAGSGDSNHSAPIESEPSAHSSSSSLGPRPQHGFR